MGELTVVVPCFNEARRLDAPALEAFFQAPRVRLVLVDDGSTDETRALLERLAARHAGRCQVLALWPNGGKAEAVRRGLHRALEATPRPEVVGYCDADLATPVEEMLRVAAEVEGPVEVALASRVGLLGRRIERSLSRHYLGRVFATAASLALDLPVYDTQCGAKAFKVTPLLEEALARPFTARWAFDVELLDRLLRPPAPHAGLSAGHIVEVPLMAWRDVKGSKLTAKAMARAGLDVAAVGLRRLARGSTPR